ncbi:alpha-galactosidase [Streptomyces sp. SID8379]|uniref:alpha-galactosidase n=1 Tax=unclassified Streptomyces TaxID=2593676 RepID=UPI00036EF028|nr:MULTISPECIES: alpha-galactosidase [unclassified Streptomyces]MYW63016.1 alpha-galactosidase [Streptomyces sp. SID8379]
MRNQSPASLVHLRSATVSVVVDLGDGRLPEIVHWGAALGDLDDEALAALALGAVRDIAPNGPDRPVRLAVLPEAGEAWLGRPGISGSRAGADWSPRFTAEPAEVTERSLRVRGTDEAAGLTVLVELELDAEGLLRVRATLTNTGDDDYQLDDLSLALPLPARARELLDLAGRWGMERTPQRTPLNVGSWVRENRRGRTGADAPLVLNAGVPGFGFAAGEVWGVHVAHSGNQRHYAERVATGDQVLGGGELLLPGEIVLPPGARHTGPWLYGAYGDGLDAQAALFHQHLRALPAHPRSPRPVTLNVWEAVYFSHDLDVLTELADIAAAVGVERYVLDDGWFHGRRDDHSGLGDWTVDRKIWPRGLHPLIGHVRSLGMEFGLWVEPEMISPDSDLARAHPEWIMSGGEGRLPVPSRHQQVLDLTHPDAFAHVLDRLTALLTEYDIAALKWDHNRDLVEAGRGRPRRPGVHAQTLAAYRLMDELHRRFPDLEIESCSSGGSRIDLGVLERTQRVWPSDCSDPLDRQRINRWTSQLVPLELLGTHIASARSHTTGRTHDLSFRAATALFGHMGVEWDLRQADEAERAGLRDWFALYRTHRELLHTGRLVREDPFDDSHQLTGVVAPDRSRALLCLAVTGRSDVARPGRFTFRALEPRRRYRIRPVAGGGARPAWYGADGQGVVLTGAALAHVGLQCPPSDPEQAQLFEVTAVT